MNINNLEPNHAVIYGRVASLGGHPLPLKEQLDAVEAEAAGRGLEVMATFTDAGLPNLPDRIDPGMEEAIAFIEHEGPCYLLVNRLDRLARDPCKLARILARLQATGGAVIAGTGDPIEDTELAALIAMLTMKAAWTD
jgi:DNA invertase Pin-like site-specific DNA recombinase